MKQVNIQSWRARKTAIAFVVAGLGVLGAMPAHADTEIEQLKRELTEQRQLIQQLLNAQKAQPAVASAPAQAPVAADPFALAVTVYGTLDVNVAHGDSGYGAKTTIGTGGMTASSLGVKGAKKLNDSLQAIGEFEAGLAINTGVVSNGAVANGVNQTAASSGGLLGNGSQIFSRQAYVGLSGNMGSATLGRQYVPSYVVAAGTGSALGAGFYGNGASLITNVGGMGFRWNNSIAYKSPSFNGFGVHALYTTGSQNNTSEDTKPVSAAVTNDQAGQGMDIAFSYKSGPLGAALSTWSFNNTSYNGTGGETGLASRKGVQLAVNYDFGLMKLAAAYVRGTIDGGNYQNVTKTLSDSTGSSISASVPFGKNTVYLGYSQLTDNSLLGKSANLIGLAYTYEISKNQNFYVNMAKLANNSVASYNLVDGGDIVGTTAVAGFQPSALAVGMNFKF